MASPFRELGVFYAVESKAGSAKAAPIPTVVKYPGGVVLTGFAWYLGEESGEAVIPWTYNEDKKVWEEQTEETVPAGEVLKHKVTKTKIRQANRRIYSPEEVRRVDIAVAVACSNYVVVVPDRCSVGPKGREGQIRWTRCHHIGPGPH